MIDGKFTSLCPLCENPDPRFFHKDKSRTYYRCSGCHLVFVPPEQYLSFEDEKEDYELHENSPLDAGYRRFLSRIFAPVNEQIQPGSSGLDFGCGPGPTLSLMFEEAGHEVVLYDPNYFPDVHVFDSTYDFITASEVVEHLHHPGIELERLWSCLKPGGVLGIMTKLVIDREAFSRWHYKEEQSHVCFFSRETFRWLGNKWGITAEFVGNDVILLRKK